MGGFILKKKLMYGAIALLLVFIGMVLATPSSNDSKENAASTKHSAKQSSRVSKYITYESSSSADEKKDTKVPAEHRAALRSAKTYAGYMNMSKREVEHQLSAQTGEKFKPDAVAYAMSNLNDIDWNANALAKAKIYQKDLSMSEDAIRHQLTADMGNKFTAEQAEYAIKHLES